MTERAETVRLTFRIRQAFPADSPLSIPLLRLMAAVNDVRYIQKSVLIAQQRVKTASPTVEGLILEGELGYLLRMLLGHLHEAGIASRDVNERYGTGVDALIRDDTSAQGEVAKLRAVYCDTQPAGLNKILLEGVRTPWAFHYKYERFKEALEKHPDGATIIVSEYAGVGRYTVTDDFAKRYIVDKVGGIEAFQQLVGEAIDLAGTLGRAVDHLLGAVFGSRVTDIIMEETNEDVLIPPEIARARNQLSGGQQ